MTETLDVDAQKLIDADVLVESQNGQGNDQDSMAGQSKGAVSGTKRRSSTRYLLSPHIESQEQSSAVSEQQVVPGSEYSLSLHVHRTTCDGLIKVVRLDLMAVSSVTMLKSLFRKLLESAFPGHLPEYLTSDEYYLFTPKEDFISLPSDSARTQFRLVAEVDGWETVVAVRELGQMVDPERRMLVTMAEFDSDPVVSEDGTTSMVVSVVAYPSVSIKKSFLDDMVHDLHRAHAALESDVKL